MGELTVLIEAANPNYETVSATATMKITPLTVTVHANDAGKVYLEEEPTLTASLNGLLNSDMEAGAPVSYSVIRESGETVGKYMISVEADKVQGNYLVVTEPGTFTISPAEMSIKAITSEKSYDGTALYGGVADELPEGTYVTYSVDKGVSWTEEVPSITHTGILKYLVRIENPNYSIADVAGTLTVNRSAVTITADNAARNYGAPDPEFTAHISGSYVVEEADQIEYSFSREPGEDVGTYSIYVSGSAQQGDYNVTYLPGVITISPADTLAVMASGFEGPYDGSKHAILAYASVEKGTALYYSTDNGRTWSADIPEILDAGEQSVLVKAENANYEPAVTEVTLRVYPRTIRLTAASATREYNGSTLSDSSYSQTGSFVQGEGADIKVITAIQKPATIPSR